VKNTGEEAIELPLRDFPEKKATKKEGEKSLNKRPSILKKRGSASINN